LIGRDWRNVQIDENGDVHFLLLRVQGQFPGVKNTPMDTDLFLFGRNLVQLIGENYVIYTYVLGTRWQSRATSSEARSKYYVFLNTVYRPTPRYKEECIFRYRRLLYLEAKGRLWMTVVESFNRPSQYIIEGYKTLVENYESVTCAISDIMGRTGAMTADIKPLFEGVRLAGTVTTAKSVGGDLSAVIKAVDLSQPGDIILVDAQGNANSAFWGENITMSAMNKGVAAAVIDGSFRDVEEIRKLKFPIFSKGIVPNVGAIAGYGHVNVPIQCAGLPVHPGDMIVIDGNGIVVVPIAESEEILNKTKALLEVEDGVQEKLKAGATIGQLIDIDQLMQNGFNYQERALENK